MKHIIIGTAGHVDHGKTALVKALTGVDTDRLAEEKRRGLTIELGFARLDFPDGSCAGVVDVPGHEKFIKNMLAGAGGIDLAMLVVAADEGVMPQTVEHLDILSLLGVRSGLVVLTKCDLVGDDWRALVRADVAARTEGTFLAGCPVVEVSSVTGQGIADLRRSLYALARQTEEKNIRAPFRLPIDRVFSVDGFGTVVTGTVIEGAVRLGDEVELAPSGVCARVRGLQVHGQRVDAAYAGQRAALNLADLKREGIRRGDAAVKRGSVRPTLLLDVRLRCLRDAARGIENGSRVHLCHGASVQLARVVLLDADRLAPGESGLAQLRLTEPIAAKKGDRFVLRFYSPLETIGGGVVLDDAPLGDVLPKLPAAGAATPPYCGRSLCARAAAPRSARCRGLPNSARRSRPHPRWRRVWARRRKRLHRPFPSFLPRGGSPNRSRDAISPPPRSTHSGRAPKRC